MHPFRTEQRTSDQSDWEIQPLCPANLLLPRKRLFQHHDPIQPGLVEQVTEGLALPVTQVEGWPVFRVWGVAHPGTAPIGDRDRQGAPGRQQIYAGGNEGSRLRYVLQNLP